MRLKVTFQTRILGDGVFWDDSANKISEIKSSAARKLAEKALKYKQNISESMKIGEGTWTVEIYT